MENNILTQLNVKVPLELKKKIQKQGIDKNLNLTDYVVVALTHYSTHIDNNEINDNII